MTALPVFEITTSPEFNVFFSMIIDFALISLGLKIVIDIFKYS